MSVLTKKWNENTVNWDEAIENYNISINKKWNVKHKPYGFFVTHDADLIEKVKESLKKLDCALAHLYFSLDTKTKTYGWHVDPVEVFYWQCIGKVEVETEDNKYILEPGDLLKIPIGMKHNFIPLTPRLGVSMSIKPTKEHIEKFRGTFQRI